MGYLPRRDELVQPERHLGLIPTAEGTVAREWYDTLTAQVAETIDLDALRRIAATADPPAGPPQVYPATPQPTRARIAVAQDKAFSFYYQDSLDLLTAWGAELLPFSPLTDAALPPGTGGVYIGGGFPELFARELSENRPMLESLRAAIRRQIPVYAECGGLMYLGQSLSDLDGVAYPMVGALPAVSSMDGRRLTLGYREVAAAAATPLLQPGQSVRGHEFHWSVLAEPPQPGHRPLSGSESG